MKTDNEALSGLKPSILIVDDEPDLIVLLKKMFEREKYQVITARDGEEAIWVLRRMAGQKAPFLMVLDLMLPVRSGFEICRFVRSHKEFRSVPVLAVSAQGGTDAKVSAFEVGVDDFMEKPFSPRELLARVNALIRRCWKVDPNNTLPHVRLTLGPLVLDTDRREVLLDGIEVALTRLEFLILHYFVLHRDRVLRKEELFEVLWDESEPVGEGNLKVHVHSLRRKLGDHATQPRFIETIRGVGYRFRNRWDGSGGRR
ncbi:MAG: response regulator transcription factor [Leptospirillum sp.]